MSNYPLDMPADEVIDRYAPLWRATHFYGDAFPWWWINLGPGIVAGFLGANVNSVIDPSETVWVSPSQKEDIKDIDLEYDAENMWWKRAKELTSAVVERYEGRLAVSHTDLGGNLDILASLLETENLLFDLIDCPAEVERVAGQITNLWLRYYDELDALIRPPCRGTSCWTPIWSTGKTYMLQCDFSYMISQSCSSDSCCPISLPAAITWTTAFITWMAGGRSRTWTCCFPYLGCVASNGSPAPGSRHLTNGCLY